MGMCAIKKKFCTAKEKNSPVKKTYKTAETSFAPIQS